MLKPKVCRLRTSNLVGGWSMRYIATCEVGLFDAGGVISCRPHPTATQLVLIVLNVRWSR